MHHQKSELDHVSSFRELDCTEWRMANSQMVNGKSNVYNILFNFIVLSESAHRNLSYMYFHSYFSVVGASFDSQLYYGIPHNG